MTDLLLNIDDGDMQISNNDLVIDVSDQQQQERLLLTEKGNVKQFIDAGVGTLKFLEAEDNGSLLREINNQFAADGMTVKQIGFNDEGNIILNAPYQ
jgi:hypothetical protein